MIQGEFWRGSKKKRLTLSESQIEMQICHYLRFIVERAYRDFFFWKSVSTGYYDTRLKTFRRQVNPYCLPGCPDIIAIWRGLFIGFEIKKPGSGRQSDAQKRFEERLDAADAYYFVVHSSKEVRDLLVQMGMELPPE